MDLIDRQAAIDAVRNIRAITGTEDDSILLINKAEVQTELMMLPSAEPKKGKWIERWHDNQHVIGDMACSVCGAQMLLTFPRFCPCCGAYMREEVTSDGKDT